jgi:hypothetical protein
MPEVSHQTIQVTTINEKDPEELALQQSPSTIWDKNGSVYENDRKSGKSRWACIPHASHRAHVDLAGIEHQFFGGDESKGHLSVIKSEYLNDALTI